LNENEVKTTSTEAKQCGGQGGASSSELPCPPSVTSELCKDIGDPFDRTTQLQKWEDEYKQAVASCTQNWEALPQDELEAGRTRIREELLRMGFTQEQLDEHPTAIDGLLLSALQTEKQKVGIRQALGNSKKEAESK
jgi:hypothetical protein